MATSGSDCIGVLSVSELACLACRGAVVKSIFAGVMVCVLLLNSGCALFDAELHNRGGFLDKLADDYWFKADSKRKRALPAFALQASLPPISSASPKNNSHRTTIAIPPPNPTTPA